MTITVKGPEHAFELFWPLLTEPAFAVDIAKKADVSKFTVRTHLQRLTDLNLIQRIETDGQNVLYCLNTACFDKYVERCYDEYKRYLKIPTRANLLAKQFGKTTTEMQVALLSLTVAGKVHRLPSPANNTQTEYVILRDTSKYGSQEEQELFGCLVEALKTPKTYDELAKIANLPSAYVETCIKQRTRGGKLTIVRTPGVSTYLTTNNKASEQVGYKVTDKALGKYSDLLEQPISMKDITAALDQPLMVTARDMKMLRDNGLIHQVNVKGARSIKLFCKYADRTAGVVMNKPKPKRTRKTIQNATSKHTNPVKIEAPTAEMKEKLGRYAPHLMVPHTPNEIADLVGCHQGNARRQLRKFMTDGLIHRRLVDPKTGQSKYCISHSKLYEEA